MTYTWLSVEHSITAISHAAATIATVNLKLQLHVENRYHIKVDAMHAREKKKLFYLIKWIITNVQHTHRHIHTCTRAHTTTLEMIINRPMQVSISQ